MTDPSYANDRTVEGVPSISVVTLHVPRSGHGAARSLDENVDGRHPASRTASSGYVVYVFPEGLSQRNEYSGVGT